MTFYLMYDVTVFLTWSRIYMHYSETALNLPCLSLRSGLLTDARHAALEYESNLWIRVTLKMVVCFDHV